MELHEQIRQAIAASIDDCIRNDASFRSYADAATEAVMKVLEKQEPIGEMLEVSAHNYELRWYRPVPFGTRLYTLPGAKGE